MDCRWLLKICLLLLHIFVPQLSALVLIGIVIVYVTSCNRQNPEINTVLNAVIVERSRCMTNCGSHACGSGGIIGGDQNADEVGQH